MDARGRGAAGTPQPSTTPGAAAAPQSWGDVPDNILVRISAFLRCRADRVHMACANRQWNVAVRLRESSGHPQPPALPPLPPQLPWLIIFPNTEAPTFYSPVGGRYHSLRGLPLGNRHPPRPLLRFGRRRLARPRTRLAPRARALQPQLRPAHPAPIGLRDPDGHRAPIGI